MATGDGQLSAISSRVMVVASEDYGRRSFGIVENRNDSAGLLDQGRMIRGVAARVVGGRPDQPFFFPSLDELQYRSKLPPSSGRHSSLSDLSLLP